MAWLFATLVFATGNLGAQEVDSVTQGRKFTSLKTALAVTSVTNRPLVVVISGDHCSWCVKQKKEIESKKDLIFDWVVVKYKDVPKMYIKGKGIPQLHIITTVDKKRVGKTHVGYKSVVKINKLIKNPQGRSDK